MEVNNNQQKEFAMKLPASFQEDQPKPIHTSNDKEEIILSDESLFKGKIYRNRGLPDDMRILRVKYQYRSL
jgi:hypothetical protein